MEKRRERMKGGCRRWGEEWCVEEKRILRVEEKRMAWGECFVGEEGEGGWRVCGGVEAWRLCGR